MQPSLASSAAKPSANTASGPVTHARAGSPPMIASLSGCRRGECRSARPDYADLSAAHAAATSGSTTQIGLTPRSA